MKILIGKKTALIFVLAIIFVIANATILYLSIRTLIKNNNQVVHTQEVLSELGLLLSNVKDAETGQRGFLITGEESYLEPYRDASSGIESHIQKLKTLTSDNQAQQQRLPVLEQNIQKRLDTLRSNLEIRRQYGLEPLLQQGALAKGKEQMEVIRQPIGDMQYEEYKLLALRTTAAAASGRNAVFTFLVSNLSILVLIGIVYFLMNRDIRERQRSEKALLEANEQLETRVQERTLELSKTNLELERSNRELQDFAFVASHDLQEPLRKIQAFGDRLKFIYAQQLGEEGLDHLDRMQSAARRMQTLINDLLTFSRVTTKAQPFVSVDLEKVTKEVLEDLETRIKDTNGTVEFADLPTIDADPLQMRQMIQNLVGNALKFHRKGTPPIVKLSAKLIKIPNEEDPTKEDICELRFEDNGIGFDIKYLDRIFTPFKRLHARDEYEGTGMGLAVCRKIVERHGGMITAESTPSEGTTFIVHLPVKQKLEE
jgi:signal transduction histidine kinase